ncbi:hypothetical protein B0H10DRAFT_2039855 [Mycena sp. CBHHK59/15]|nr:hypothetical protein B0H10DRAFT_2039855 [Mycena sp. CBHHK59/15]
MQLSHVLTTLCLLCASEAQSTETEVTLWQFGVPRLLGAQVTLPLQPMGTAGDGSATTYLYQALNAAEVITTDESGFVTKTIKSATPRTIVASASGWVELFAMNSISCALVDSTFGQCLNMDTTSTILANSGAPTPVVIAIAASSTQISTSPTLTTPATSNSAPPPVPSPSETNKYGPATKKPLVGAIIGGIVSALLLIIGMLVALFWRRRRRLNRMAKDLSPQPYTAPMAANGLIYIRGTPNSQDRQQSKRAPGGATLSVPAVSSLPSDIPTSELAWALYHRMKNQDFAGAPPPPGYV